MPHFIKLTPKWERALRVPEEDTYGLSDVDDYNDDSDWEDYCRFIEETQIAHSSPKTR